MIRTFSVNHVYLRNNKSIRVKENTRYSGKNPAQAAKKVFTQYIKKCPKRTRVLHINLRESTHGSSDRVYRYEVRRVKLEKPVVRFPGTKKEFTIHNQISVKSLGIVKPKPVRKQTGSGKMTDKVILDLLKHPSFQRFKSVPRKKGWDLVKEGVKRKCFSKDEKTRLRCLQAIGNKYGVKYTGTLAQFKLDQDWWKKTITHKFLYNLIEKSKIKYGRGRGGTDTEQPSQLKRWNLNDTVDREATEVKNNGADETVADNNSENGDDEASSDDNESENGADETSLEEKDDTNEMKEVYQPWSYTKMAVIFLFISITAGMYKYWGEGVAQAESDFINWLDITAEPDGWKEGHCAFPNCREYDTNNCLFNWGFCLPGTTVAGQDLVGSWRIKNENMLKMRTKIYGLLGTLGGAAVVMRKMLNKYDNDRSIMIKNLRDWVELVRNLMMKIWGPQLSGWKYSRNRSGKITAVTKIKGVYSKRLRLALECIFLAHIRGKPDEAFDKFSKVWVLRESIRKNLKGKGLKFFNTYLATGEHSRKNIETLMNNLQDSMKEIKNNATETAINAVVKATPEVLEQHRENQKYANQENRAIVKKNDEITKSHLMGLLRSTIEVAFGFFSGGTDQALRVLCMGIVHQLVNKLGGNKDDESALFKLNKALENYDESKEKRKKLDEVIKNVLPRAFPNEERRNKFTTNIKLIRENKEGLEIMLNDFPKIHAEIMKSFE